MKFANKKYRPGKWKLYDDRTGFTVWGNKTKQEWDGYVVHPEQFEQRHPSSLKARTPRESRAPDLVRPDQDNITVPTVTGLPDGTNDNDI